MEEGGGRGPLLGNWNGGTRPGQRDSRGASSRPQSFLFPPALSGGMERQPPAMKL